MNLLSAIGGVFALVYGLIAFLAIKNRLLGRLALREGVRRPGQTALVVGGLMVGAAAITAAAIGVDSARESAVENAYRSWGEIDLTITASDEVFPASVARRIAEDERLEGDIDGVSPGIEVFGSAVNKTKKESDSGVRLVGFDPETQAAFGPYVLTDGTRTAGADLGNREVIVSRQLAEDLRVEPGDELKMGVAPLEKPKPTPKQLGNRLRATGNEVKRLQKEAERKAKAVAKRAGEAAAKAEAERIADQLETQGQALAAEYMADLRAWQQGLRDSIRAAKEAERELGLPPGSIPPFLFEPVPPDPPALAAPGPAEIEEHVAAVAQRAAEDAAKRVGRRYAKRAKRLVRRLDDLKDRLEETLDELKPVVVKVAGIARAEGPGAFGLASAMFAPLPLVQDIANTDEVNVVRISGNGDATSGFVAATRALPEIRASLAAMNGTLDIEDGQQLKVVEVKKEEVNSAEDSAEFTLTLLTAMSILVLASGVALVINLTQMLAEERRPRLAILRAMGLTRKGLVRLSTFEGAFYSLLAAAVGTFVGIFAGRMLAERFGRAFAELFSGQIDYRFRFSLKWQTLVAAFAAGALFTLATVWISAWRTSRMSIPAAIRSLPEPARERHHRRWPRLVFGGLLFLTGLALLAAPLEAMRVIGGVIVVGMVSRLLKSRVPDRARRTVQGLMMAAWSLLMVWSVKGPDDPQRFFSTFVAAVIVSVVGLATATAANLPALEGVVKWLAGLLGTRFRAGLTPPMAYLARRTSRTGLSIVMFAVVMAIISMSSVFFFIFRPQYERDSLGYDLIVTNLKKKPVKLPDVIDAEIAARADIKTKVYTGSLDTEFQDFEQVFAPLYFLTPEQLGRPPMRLAAREERFDSDAEVWEAVRTDPKWVVSDFGRPGNEVTLEDENGEPVTFTIAANPALGLFTGFSGTPEKFEGFDTAARGYTSLLAVRDNKRTEAVVSQIDRRKYNDGITTEVVRELMDRGYRANRAFFSVVNVLMRLGLVVGILSLGILGLRAIIERRHLIGVMRAVGFYRRAVMGGLLVEAGSTATLGVAVGTVTGLALGYIFFLSFFEEAVFGVDRQNLWSAIAMVFAAVFSVTIGPAWRASRLPPAEAVRYTE